MGEINKVTVKIYGQEYTIAGEMPRDHIIRVADYVDRKMHEIEKGMPNSAASSLAVLSAVNAADDYFTASEENEKLREKCIQLEKDTQQYVQLWDEAKKSFLQYKEEAQVKLAHMDELQKLFNEKTIECSTLSNQKRELEEKYSALKKKNEDLVNRMQAEEEAKANTSSVVKELEAKCKDIENSFFDLQMENIQLKGELDRYKKIVE